MSFDPNYNPNDVFNHFKQGNIDGMLDSMLTDLTVKNLKTVEAQLAAMIKKMEEQQKKAGKNKQYNPFAGFNMNQKLDPYVILGVSRTATQEEVKKAYIKKSYAAHTDHGGKVEDMVKVNASWEAICRINGWHK